MELDVSPLRRVREVGIRPLARISSLEDWLCGAACRRRRGGGSMLSLRSSPGRRALSDMALASLSTRWSASCSRRSFSLFLATSRSACSRFSRSAWRAFSRSSASFFCFSRSSLNLAIRSLSRSFSAFLCSSR